MEPLRSPTPPIKKLSTWSCPGTQRPSGWWILLWWRVSPLLPVPNPPSHRHRPACRPLSPQRPEARLDVPCRRRTWLSCSVQHRGRWDTTEPPWARGSPAAWRPNPCTPPPSCRPPNVWAPRGGTPPPGRRESARNWSSAVSVRKIKKQSKYTEKSMWNIIVLIPKLHLKTNNTNVFQCLNSLSINYFTSSAVFTY